LISKNVMKLNNFDDSIYYKADCSCGDSDHEILIEFEKDKECPDMIFLNFYKNIAWCSHWGSDNIFYNFWKRVKCAIKVLFTGYVELEESFIIQGEDSINDIIKALEEGKEYIKGTENDNT